MGLGEFELIDRYFRRASTGRHTTASSAVALGVGDDCALIDPPPGRQLAISSDTLVEGVHFPAGAPPDLLATRALRVNLSDLAGCAATPLACTLALTLPRADADWLEPFANSLHETLAEYRIDLVGGDTTRGPLALTVTVIGSVEPGAALLRSGAADGDDLWVSGTLGDAAAALELGRLDGDDVLGSRFWLPEPRLQLARRLRPYLTAGLDLSDGLLADAGHIARASGLAVIIEAERVPRSEALQRALPAGRGSELALTGGDDYELCVAASPQNRQAIEATAAELGIPVTRVGWLEPGSGVTCRAADGSQLVLEHPGYQHFGG